MAIVPLKRITLIGELKRRGEALLELQRMGCVHLVDLSSSGTNSHGAASNYDGLKSAIAYLDRCPEKRPAAPLATTGDSTEVTESDRDEIKRMAAEVLQIESQSRKLAEEQEWLTEQIGQTRPWGHFRLPASNELRGRQLYFYRLTPSQAREVPLEVRQRCGFTLINRDRQHEYRVAIAEIPPVDIPVEPERLDSRSLSELESRLDEIGEQAEILQLRRIAFTRLLEEMREELVAIEDETARITAEQYSLVDGPVFVLQGWAPRRNLARWKRTRGKIRWPWFRVDPTRMRNLRRC